jgi:LAS superfamily LD-carboxypeptidase LdcB
MQPYAEWLVSAAPSAGARTVRITSVRRSKAQQQQLYRNWLAGRSRFPAAPPGSSKHEYGLAFDMVTEPFSVLTTLGDWWRQLGGEWSPTDPIHFAAKWE